MLMTALFTIVCAAQAWLALLVEITEALLFDARAEAVACRAHMHACIDVHMH